MPNLPLIGKTIVLTGTSKTITVLEKIEQLGGKAISLPLIETTEIVDSSEHIQLKMAKNVDWLIFTSQNAVEAFCNKMKRHHLNKSDFHGKIAAVGSKTAKLLKKNNFQVSFMPSVFSADVFVKEFPFIVGENPKCLFIRGRKAKDTIKKGLPFLIEEWIVYETRENRTSIEPLLELIQSNDEPIIVFASPSAVDVFAQHVAPIIGWNKVKLAAIGHITANAIEKYGAIVTYQPKVYTMEAVIEEISKREEV